MRSDTDGTNGWALQLCDWSVSSHAWTEPVQSWVGGSWQQRKGAAHAGCGEAGTRRHDSVGVLEKNSRKWDQRGQGAQPLDNTGTGLGSRGMVAIAGLWADGGWRLLWLACGGYWNWVRWVRTLPQSPGGRRSPVLQTRGSMEKVGFWMCFEDSSIQRDDLSHHIYVGSWGKPQFKIGSDLRHSPGACLQHRGAFSYCFHNAGNFFRPQHLFAASSPCPGIRFHPCKAELENLASRMLPGLLPQPGASQHHGLGATAELPDFPRIDENQVHGQETEIGDSVLGVYKYKAEMCMASSLQRN